MLRQLRTIRNRICAGMLCLIWVLMLVPTQSAQAAKLAKPDAKGTSSNILAVLSEYDTETYYIMKTMRSNGYDFSRWWSKDQMLIERLDTAIHETYHNFTYQTSNTFFGENIYAGYGLNIDFSAANLKFFPTSQMAAQLPTKYKTFRYDTYVTESSVASANVYGVYGLINEFSAYYWGLHAMTSLIPYAKTQPSNDKVWTSYVSSLGNNMNAYCEFKFWILNYMIYAKEHKPSLYKALLKNEGFCNAYLAIETQFANLIACNKKYLPTLNEWLAKHTKGATITWDSKGVFFRKNLKGTGVEIKDYTKLKSAMKGKKYVQMDELIKKKATISKSDLPVLSTSMKEPVITGAKRGTISVKLSWKRVKGATGYEIYKSTDGGKYQLVKTMKKGSTVSYKDKAIQNGHTYRYRIKAVNVFTKSKLSQSCKAR